MGFTLRVCLKIALGSTVTIRYGVHSHNMTTQVVVLRILAHHIFPNVPTARNQ